MTNDDAKPNPIDRDPESGKFQPGNQVARRTGVRQFQTRGADALPDEIRAALEQFRDGLVSDQGGEQELTTVGRGYVRLA